MQHSNCPDLRVKKVKDTSFLIVLTLSLSKISLLPTKSGPGNFGGLERAGKFSWKIRKIPGLHLEYRVTGKECNLEHLSMFLVK